MARFDIYRVEDTTLLLDVQADLLVGLNTRIVVPLLPLAAAPKLLPRLNPKFDIHSEQYAMMSQLLAAVPMTILVERIGNLREEQDTIAAALDMAFYGF